MDVLSQALSGLRWNLIIRGAGQFATWTITLVVMRLLTPADYGLLAMATVVLVYLSTLAEMGMSAAIVQAREIDNRKLRQTFGAALVTNTTVALLVLLSAPLLADFYREPRLAAILRALALQFLMNGLMVIPRGLAQRKMDFKALSLVQMGGILAGAVLTLGMAASGQGVWSLVTGNLLNVLVQVAALNWRWGFAQWPLFSVDASREMLAFGARVAGIGLLWLFWSQADILIAGRLLGKELLGAYSIGIQIASMPLSRFSEIVTQVAFPAFSRLQHDPAAVRSNLMRSIKVAALGSFAVFWGISCIAPEVIAVIGPRWEAAVLPLRILALIMPVRLISTFTSMVVRSTGRADIDFRNMLVSAVVLPTGYFAGCYWGGLTGLCMIWVTVVPCVYWWIFRNCLGPLGLQVIDLLRAVRIPALAGALMYAATAGLRLALRTGIPGAARAALLAAAGAAVYCGAVWVFDRESINLLVKLLRSVTGTRQVRTAERSGT